MLRARQNGPDNKTCISDVTPHRNRHLIGVAFTGIDGASAIRQSVHRAQSCVWTLNTFKTPTNQKKLGTQRLKNSAPKSAVEGPRGMASTRRQSSQELLKWMHPRADTSDIGMRTFLLFFFIISIWVLRFEFTGPVKARDHLLCCRQVLSPCTILDRNFLQTREKRQNWTIGITIISPSRWNRKSRFM